MEEYVEKFVGIAKEKDIEIVDVDFVNRDLMKIRIAYFDHRPITVETCAEMNQAFGEAINYEISLDVSSAGAERVIDEENYDSLTDQYVMIKFKNPYKGGDYVEGTVLSVDEDGLNISYQVMHKHKEIKIYNDNIALCRLAVKV